MDQQEQVIWQACHESAQELEAFEPGLCGLDACLTSVEHGQALSEVWMAKSKHYLWQNHAVAELGLKLNQIAGLYFSENEFEKAKLIAECSLNLHRACLGDEHEASVVLADNLKKLDAAMRPKKMPKLWRFSRTHKK